MKSLVPLLLLLASCAGGPRLDFPRVAIESTPTLQRFDVDGDTLPDFTMRAGPSGRLDSIEYDDDQDGVADRVFRMSDVDPARVPHLILLIDSIPFEASRERAADWSWFGDPVRVIPPFPSMSAVIFSRILHAPPQPGAINQYWDRRTGRRVDRIFERLTGDRNAWERRLTYRLGYLDNGSSFLRPRPWFRSELGRVKRAFDRSPDRVTIAYIASSAGMLSQYGRDGLDECLDGIERLCLQLLHERAGQVHISVLSDHGHTLRDGTRIDLERLLKDAGLKPGNRLRDDHDVVIELDGLVNYVGIHARRARPVGEVLASSDDFELSFWLEGEEVVVRSSDGEARIRSLDGATAYEPVTADVLGYDAIGLADGAFRSPSEWLTLTADHRFPDAPTRLWEAFHGLVVSTPTVMAVTAPGRYVGKPSFEWFIDMASTHGGIDQVDSAAILLTTTGRATGPVRSHDVLPMIEPTFDPSRLRR